MVSRAAAGVNYFDATSTNTVKASDESANWFTGSDVTDTTGSTAADGLWRYRISQGPIATELTHRGIWEASSGSALLEDAVELKTTMTAVPDGLYDIYVFYCSFADENNRIRAGFSSNPNANTLYDKLGTAGIAGKLALSGPDQLTFDNINFTGDDTEQLYYAIIGQANVTTGTLSVFIDDFPAAGTTLANRSWYSGVGYGLPTSVLEIDSVVSGLASAASTWSNNQPPSSANNYNVLASHIVEVNAPFPGKRLKVKSGGTANFSASQQDIRYMSIEAGGALTESVSGDFVLGDAFAQVQLGILDLAQDVTFNMDAGADFELHLATLGAGNLTFNSNGPGSDLLLVDTSEMTGKVTFAGTGDEVRIVRNLPRRIEMDATGANRLQLLTEGQQDGGAIVFNSPGEIVHATNITSPLSRAILPSSLTANAAIVVNLESTFPTHERRLDFTEGIAGSGPITVNGTATDPTSGSITLNEFELGGSTEPSGSIVANSYSGTLTANHFVNVEFRHSLPSAKIVVNQDARFEMGHPSINTAKVLEFGEIVVNAGGALEVGFEQVDASAGTGNHVGHLHLSNASGQNGNLTLANGTTTIMQVNGAAANQFDTITADGTIALGGTLRILVNPPASNGTNTTYAPQLDDLFTIMTASGGASLATNFDGVGGVDGGDLAVWRSAFGSSAAGDSDDDQDSDGIDFLAWQRDFGAMPAGGITGDFLNVVVVDPSSTMSSANLGFQLMKNGSSLQLKVISASAVGVITAVPEPSSIGIALVGALWLVRRRRCSI